MTFGGGGDWFEGCADKYDTKDVFQRHMDGRSEWQIILSIERYRDRTYFYTYEEQKNDWLAELSF